MCLCARVCVYVCTRACVCVHMCVIMMMMLNRTLLSTDMQQVVLSAQTYKNNLNGGPPYRPHACTHGLTEAHAHFQMAMNTTTHVKCCMQ